MSRGPGLRVIAGRAKGRRLKRVPGEAVRPIMDRVKESLFNIIRPALPGSNFLDLFAGTGSVGIEALSQGAARATLVDTEKAAIETIKANLRITGLGELATVVRVDAFQFISSRGPGSGGGHHCGRPPQPFDFVYVAPPQYQGIWARAVQAVDATGGLVNPDGQVIVQLDPVEYRELALTHLLLTDRRRYGNTLLCFYEWPGE